MSSPGTPGRGTGAGAVDYDPSQYRPSLVQTHRVRLVVPVADIFTELIAQGLAGVPHASKLWRDLVIKDLSFFSSPISEEIRDESRTRRRAEDILVVLEARGIDVPDGTRDRITGCDDPELLRSRLVRAATATSAGEVARYA
ncbi:hypothetical protein ACGFRG_28425 [Streptomyces sp. NPDC048696]|uniref:hypothetical protein n=1 Tax=Streptomyces sp. NPDC048696 TaxID=3365585 RepID=UPI00371A5F2E